MSPAYRRKVLAIDDDRLVGAMLVSHATAAGFEARVTVDPVEFMEWERTWRPDFVVVDLVMGKVDGLAVLKMLADAHSPAAVVIASGMGAKVLESARQFAAANGLAYGGVLAKPFRRADVIAVLAAGANVPEQRDTSDSLLDEWDHEQFEQELRGACESDQLWVAMQPKIRCADGSVAGYEALVRWDHPTAGTIPPIAFIPRAESVRLASLVTDAVAAKALAWFSAARPDTTERLSINISATELSDSNLDTRLLTIAQATGVKPQRIVLELTETSAMADGTSSLETLTRLRLEGFQLSIDDFGTGYSSMAQLSSMPFTEVKIDRSFVLHLGTSAASDVMVRSMLGLSKGLGLECTAEGVEDQLALDKLRDMGCEFAQGYHIARPMPFGELDKWLRRNNAA